MTVERSAFDEPWRVACPWGHVGLRPLENCRMAYCKRCRRSYGFEDLTDLKERRRRERRAEA